MCERSVCFRQLKLPAESAQTYTSWSYELLVWIEIHTTFSTTHRAVSTCRVLFLFFHHFIYFLTSSRIHSGCRWSQTWWTQVTIPWNKWFVKKKKKKKKKQADGKDSSSPPPSFTTKAQRSVVSNSRSTVKRPMGGDIMSTLYVQVMPLDRWWWQQRTGAKLSLKLIMRSHITRGQSLFTFSPSLCHHHARHSIYIYIYSAASIHNINQ